MKHYIELQERIARIVLHIKDLTSIDELFRDREFREIHSDPSPYAAAALQLYADEKQSAFNKEIAGYAMQKLPLDEFVPFVATVTDEVAMGGLDARLLERLAFPEVHLGSQFAFNYKRPDVQTLLKRIVALERLSAPMRNYITDRVMTGLARADILDMREAGQIP